MPKVTVLLPAFNADNTLAKAIQSIVDQSYINWELVVINDGSKDNTEAVINSFNDDRILYLKNDKNRGLIYTLNRGISVARGEYIARMDADDISLPERLSKQVVYMDTHPDVIVCGTQIEYFGTKSTRYHKIKFPLANDDLKDMLVTSTCFAHPTVMIRKSVFEHTGIQYDIKYKNAEDYSLWIDLAPYGNFANLNEKLLLYRVSDTQISQPFNPQTINSVIACKKKSLRKYLDEPIIESLFNNPIDIPVLKKVKRQTSNKKIWEGCYLSLDNYNLSAFLYYVFSLDIFKLGVVTFFRFLKRFILGKAPIFYNTTTII
ncbi:MAG: glycosyltransferase [Alistipes sp.]|nr:glycosyltransferase [Alistipes sp.]